MKLGWRHKAYISENLVTVPLSDGAPRDNRPRLYIRGSDYHIFIDLSTVNVDGLLFENSCLYSKKNSQPKFAT